MEIKTSDIECGDDLAEGVVAIDGSRVLLGQVRSSAKDIKYLDLKDCLLSLVDSWRAYLRRRHQYFVNMLLFPVVGYGKERVKVHFEGWWLEPREFTVKVTPKEKRGFKHDSGYHLRSLQEVVTDINDTAVEVKDLAVAFGELKVDPADNELLLPLVQTVVDAVNTMKDGKDIEHKHRLHQL